MNEKKIPFWRQPESRRLEFKEAWPKGDQIARQRLPLPTAPVKGLFSGSRMSRARLSECRTVIYSPSRAAASVRVPLCA